MPPDNIADRALVVQLARLGDLIQSLPAITALRAASQIAEIDLLCAAPLVSIASCTNSIDRVLPWEVERWRAWADRWTSARHATLHDIKAYLKIVVPKSYDVTFNLNQHSRAMATAHLFGKHVIGPGERGPLTTELPPWAEYLRGVVRERERNRVHLTDVFCGLCGVMPTGRAPRLLVPTADLPSDLAIIGNGQGPWVAVVVGAGDTVRCVPPMIWRDWIRMYLDASPEGQVVLIGSGADRERAVAIQEGLPSLCLGRIWDATGRTTIIQTAAVLGRCQWIVGSDTGPLHLGTAVGAQAVGFYFGRARVHETGPYGEGHWTWQVQPSAGQGTMSEGVSVETIDQWPIAQSVQLIVDEQPGECQGWTLWQSHLDQWGAYYVANRANLDSGERREEVWRRIHRPLSLKAHAPKYV